MVIEQYLTTIGQHPTAEEMMQTVVTEEFETGMRGGDMWRGLEDLREFLAARAEFFDQHSELKAILSMTPFPNGDLEATTRLDFFMRRWRPPAAVSEEFTGTAFHTWKIRDVGGRLRIASLVIDGFANLNENARRLISSPVSGEDIEE
jgi:hypothetical protein